MKAPIDQHLEINMTNLDYRRTWANEELYWLYAEYQIGRQELDMQAELLHELDQEAQMVLQGDPSC